MRLDSAHITKFKLLEDLDLRFSSDSARPLTVIRAENGSGKTSILLALRWGMWGEEGLPQRMALTSTAMPVGEPVTVQVSISFSERDMYSGKETRYRLIRSCIETRSEGDEYQRTIPRVRLLQLADQGSVDIEVGMQARINAMLPFILADVFFTDGDAVQSFVAGADQSERDRQEYVHQAIRQLLGFDEVESAEKVLGTISKSFRRELRDSGSMKLKLAEEQLEEIEDNLAKKRGERVQIRRRIEGVDQQIREDERALDRIKGIGDLDAIQARIHRFESDIKHLETEESNVRQQMKDLLQSEGLSRRMLGPWLQSGVDVLANLEDDNVIPGMSVGLLHDRLDLGVCICGLDLTEGDPRHAHVLELIEHQRQTEPWLKRLTELRHESRVIARATPESSGTDGAFADRLHMLRNQFTDCKDQHRQKSGDLTVERDRRKQIGEQRVRDLTERLESSRAKKSEFDQAQGEIGGDIHDLEEQLGQQKELVGQAERQEQLNDVLRRRSQVAGDLLALTSGILARLKSDYVHRVSERLNDLFLEIVGADLTADSRLFTGVNIVSGSYDMVVHAQEGRTLDVVTELNGASKRALTLSLIWALMVVAEKEAPRIIDTPLGMTSGAVKHRMVELLTSPVDATGLPYQVVLFMTRSEIRDIEQLIQERAGVITTLTCSKDYPVDLVNDWGTSYPVVRTCPCDHTQICRLCERRNDQGRFRYREVSD